MTIQVSKWSPDYIQSLAIQELQAFQLAGYVVEGDFTSLVDQSGSPVDTPHVVSYGVNKHSNSGIVDYTDGVITFLKSGNVAFKSRLRAGRTGASGVSHLFFWVEASTNGGSTWIKIGNSINIHLDDSTETQVFFDFTPIQASAGFKLRTMFARSSTGNDSGDLMTSAPSATLTGLGVMPAPSAQITVYKLNNYNYV